MEKVRGVELEVIQLNKKLKIKQSSGVLADHDEPVLTKVHKKDKRNRRKDKLD